MAQSIETSDFPGFLTLKNEHFEISLTGVIHSRISIAAKDAPEGWHDFHGKEVLITVDSSKVRHIKIVRKKDKNGRLSEVSEPLDYRVKDEEEYVGQFWKVMHYLEVVKDVKLK